MPFLTIELGFCYTTPISGFRTLFVTHLPAVDTEPGLGFVVKSLVRHPGGWNVELSMAKNSYLREDMRLQFRAEMWNARNHVNLNYPNGSLTRNCLAISPAERYEVDAQEFKVPVQAPTCSRSVESSSNCSLLSMNSLL